MNEKLKQRLEALLAQRDALGRETAPGGIERREFGVESLEIRAAGDEPKKIVGHASVFNQEADIGGWFIESVAPGAFRRAIAEDDVRSLFNHDPNYPLGRNRAGTLKLREDDTGLWTETDPPDTTYARDLLVSIDRGDVSGMSFGFRVVKQEWDESGDILKRKITEVELFDVSPVTFPAYTQTDVALRSVLQSGVPDEIAELLSRQGKAKGLTTVSAAPLVKRTLLQRSLDRGNFCR